MTDALLEREVVEATDDTRSMILLNDSGDVEVTWDSTNDDVMRDLIDKKMKEGVRFFILKPLPGGFLYRKTAMKTMDDLKENKVKVGDKDVEKLFEAGKVQVIRNTSGATLETQGVAKTAAEAASKRTVGIKPLQGG